LISQTATAINPGDNLTGLDSVNDMIKNGKFIDALSQLNLSIQNSQGKDPRIVAYAYCLRGQSYLGINKPDSAIADFTQAINLSRLLLMHTIDGVLFTMALVNMIWR